MINSESLLPSLSDPLLHFGPNYDTDRENLANLSRAIGPVAFNLGSTVNRSATVFH